MKFRTLNPATEKETAEFEFIGANELEKIIQTAFVACNKRPPDFLHQRILCLQKLSELLITEKEKLAQLITLEMGKPIRESRAEIDKCSSLCRFYAENAETFLTPEKIISDTCVAEIFHEPLGIIAGIMPWNFPFWQTFRFAVPAILAGNSTLVKPAPNTPQCALACEQIFSESGFAKGILQFIFLDVEDTELLLADNRIAGVAITGSEQAGISVAQIAGKYLKKIVLELGGSDPFIVLDDADLNQAAHTGIHSRFINGGQSCIAAKRFMIHQKVYNEFRKNFCNEISNLSVGDPMDFKTMIGPMARKDLLDQLEKQVEEMISSGGKIIAGGKRMLRKGFFFEPTIIELPLQDMNNFQSEIFGPVAVLSKFNSEKEAIQAANNSKFGLGATVFSCNEKRADQIARQLDCGSVAINTMMKSNPAIPFGGIKRSGYGKELGKAGIMEFVNSKAIIR